MATIGLIFWFITIFVCLCILFKCPKFISKHFNNYRFPDYSRKFTALDNDFISHHVELIENYRATSKKYPKNFIIKSPAYLLLCLGLMFVMGLMLIFGGKYVIWLIDVIGNRPPIGSFYLVARPFGGTCLTLLVGGVLSVAIISPAIQFSAVKNNKEQVASFLLIPPSHVDEGTPEMMKKRTTDDLEVLIRKGVFNSDRSYTIDEIMKISVTIIHKHYIKMVLASLLLFFSIFLMTVFQFVKISNNNIIYSPAYSFKITVKNFEDVRNANFICASRGPERFLKLLVELDNGYKFKVQEFKAKHMEGILAASNISLTEIDEANKRCKNKK